MDENFPAQKDTSELAPILKGVQAELQEANTLFHGCSVSYRPGYKRKYPEPHPRYIADEFQMKPDRRVVRERVMLPVPNPQGFPLFVGATVSFSQAVDIHPQFIHLPKSALLRTREYLRHVTANTGQTPLAAWLLSDQVEVDMAKHNILLDDTNDLEKHSLISVCWERMLEAVAEYTTPGTKVTGYDEDFMTQFTTGFFKAPLKCLTPLSFVYTHAPHTADKDRPDLVGWLTSVGEDVQYTRSYITMQPPNNPFKYFEMQNFKRAICDLPKHLRNIAKLGVADERSVAAWNILTFVDSDRGYIYTDYIRGQAVFNDDEQKTFSHYSLRSEWQSAYSFTGNPADVFGRPVATSYIEVMEIIGRTLGMYHEIALVVTPTGRPGWFKRQKEDLPLPMLASGCIIPSGNIGVPVDSDSIHEYEEYFEVLQTKLPPKAFVRVRAKTHGLTTLFYDDWKLDIASPQALITVLKVACDEASWQRCVLEYRTYCTARSRRMRYILHENREIHLVYEGLAEYMPMCRLLYNISLDDLQTVVLPQLPRLIEEFRAAHMAVVDIKPDNFGIYTNPITKERILKLCDLNSVIQYTDEALIPTENMCFAPSLAPPELKTVRRPATVDLRVEVYGYAQLIIALFGARYSLSEPPSFRQRFMAPYEQRGSMNEFLVELKRLTI